MTTGHVNNVTGVVTRSMASLAPKTPLTRRVSLRLAAPGLRPTLDPALTLATVGGPSGRYLSRPVGRSHVMRKPSTCSSSVSAVAGSSTLMVVMPISRAGLRLIPRSSRNTHSSGSTPSSSHARA